MEPTQSERRTEGPAEQALRLHPHYRGKVQIMPKCPVRGMEDFAVWYTPGVAASSRAIATDPELVWSHTNRANSIAIVSDGSRVLGLGDIGPEAGLPVMEGKALLFKYLGGVDAVPICVDTSSADELVAVVEALQPSFGGVNLEDISQPMCFEVLDRLRASLSIPVWHDDQQGTATVVVAALRNALEIVQKPIDEVRIALVGIGAANMAVYRLLPAAGVDPGRIVACDRGGILHPGRSDIELQQDRFPDKWKVCLESNAERQTGGIADALRGADVCLAFSSPGPDTIEPAWVSAMADDAIVFACANPTPEIWPWVATEAGARVVATGRSDFPNQVNNSLGFPGIFRGVLDVRASRITDEMALAAADVLAGFARRRGLEHGLLPTMAEWEVVPDIAVATAVEAQRQGLARLDTTPEELADHARHVILDARRATELLFESGIIPPPPSSADSPAG
jgi:malate dehydrogenase (oxaloacetate-decarboxylating)